MWTKRVIISIILFGLFSVICIGQVNLPIIDLPQYNNQFRLKGAFSRSPLPERSSRKISAPIMLNGYLLVYNEDLGYFNNHPDGLISNLNEQRKFGRNNWRIPTPDELCAMEDNADKLGMGSDIYMCTDYANGTLRLVSTEGDYHNLIKVGNTYWMKTNLGANTTEEAGSLVSYEDAVKFCPKGYRLPTKQELDELIVSGKACFGGKYGANRNSSLLYFPYVDEFFHYTDYLMGRGYNISEGLYWGIGGKYIYFNSDKAKPKIESSNGNTCAAVRYVLDK